VEKAIIFDMDGTLFQTDLILERALEITFDELCKSGLWSEKTPIEKYREIMGVPLPVVWETLCPNHTVEVRNQSNKFFQDQLIQLIRSHKGGLYPNTEKVLEALSKKYKLFIASNGQIEYLKAIVETFGLGRFIENIYSIQMITSGHKSDLVKKVIEENNFFWVNSLFNIIQQRSDYGSELNRRSGSESRRMSPKHRLKLRKGRLHSAHAGS